MDEAVAVAAEPEPEPAGEVKAPAPAEAALAPAPAVESAAWKPVSLSDIPDEAWGDTRRRPR